MKLWLIYGISISVHIYPVSKKLAGFTNARTLKKPKIHKMIYLNYAMIWNVLYLLRVFSIFSHGRLTVADPECVYIFASILNFRSFSIFQSTFLKRSIITRRKNAREMMQWCSNFPIPIYQLPMSWQILWWLQIYADSLLTD